MWQWETDLTNFIKSDKWEIMVSYWWEAFFEFAFIMVLLGLIALPWFIKEEHWSMRLMVSGLAFCIAMIVFLIITVPK